MVDICLNEANNFKKMENKTKTAMVAAVSEALRYKEIHPKAADEEIIVHVVKLSDKILGNID